MAKSNHNSSENNDDNRRTNGKRRKIEPARKAPDSERGLTHSPYFNGPLYERMSQDLHLGSRRRGLMKNTFELSGSSPTTANSRPTRSPKINCDSSFSIRRITKTSPADRCVSRTRASSFSTLARANATGKRLLRCGSKTSNGCRKCSAPSYAVAPETLDL